MTNRVFRIALLTASAAWSQPPVVVARIRNVQASEYVMVSQARPLAVRLLAQAGLRLVWDGRDPQAETIAVQIDDRAPHDVPLAAMAYALPFASGPATRVHVLRSRLQPPPSISAGTMLGYILAHEIAHVLEGGEFHSNAGVMKARWEIPDYLAMQQDHLGFTPEDVQRMQMHFRATASSR
jgi:hypothetical protein